MNETEYRDPPPVEYIVVPERVVLRLVDSDHKIFRLKNVLFNIHAYATTRRNDFKLGPFASDENGVVTITKADLLAEVDATYDSGLMDYDRFESCHVVVRIRAMDVSEVERALDSRTNVWRELLRGESQRWASIEDLRDLYRSATNKLISAESIRVRWDGKTSEYEYSIVAKQR
jgi:hypothetical protein